MNVARRRRWWLAGVAIAMAIVVVAAYWASSDPDGLERVATERGFAERGASPPFELLPDYAIPGLDGPASTIAAGILGVTIVFGLVVLAGRLLARRDSG